MRILFSRNFAHAKFRENKTLPIVQNHSHFLLMVNSAPVAIFYVANMPFNAIRENKIIAKISEFTVSKKRKIQIIHLDSLERV